MELAAISLAKTVGYENAGTVEYLFMEDTQEFAFLELNPRLQVEHPVTENILGINLPACQLQVSMGIPLHRIGDIRRIYGRHELGKDTIDFEYSERIPMERHCIAVRVTAENPESGFQPTSGKIHELQFRSSIDVWGYFSVKNNGTIHEFADSQFGHIFASGSDRESARKAMVVALKELDIRGEIRTTIEYIVELLQSDDFVANSIDTTWLDSRLTRSAEVAAVAKVKLDPRLVLLCGSALKAFRYFESKKTEFVDMLQAGQIPSKKMLTQAVQIDLIYKNVKYKTKCYISSRASILVECNKGVQSVFVRHLADDGYLMNINGLNHLVYSTGEIGGSFRMTLDGHSCIFTPEYDPTRLTSSVAGKIARLLVQDGAHVGVGDPYVEIEVMKMYMPLKVSESGVIRFFMGEGATLSPGDLIAMMSLDNPETIVKSEDYFGTLCLVDSVDRDRKIEEEDRHRPHIILRESCDSLMDAFEGFYVADQIADIAFGRYINALENKLLPFYEIHESLAVLRGRIDATIGDKISNLNYKYREVVESGGNVDYPAEDILKTLHDYLQSCPPEKKGLITVMTSNLWVVLESFLYPVPVRVVSSLLKFVDMFLATEQKFDDMSFTDVVSRLRKESSNDLLNVYSLCRSHVNINAKNRLLVLFIEQIQRINPPSIANRPKLVSNVPLRSDVSIRQLKRRLTDLSTLNQPIYSHVALCANLVLMEQYTMTIEQRRQRLNEVITASLLNGDTVGQGERATHLQSYAESNIAIRDLLLECLTQDKDYQLAFIELYLRKLYQKTHHLSNMQSGYNLGMEKLDRVIWLKFNITPRGIDAVSGVDAVTSGLPRAQSFSELSSLARSKSLNTTTFSDSESEDSFPASRSNLSERFGIFASFETLDAMINSFIQVIGKIPPVQSGPVNVCYITIMSTFGENDEETSRVISQFLVTKVEELKLHGIRVLTFLVGHKSSQFHAGGAARIPSILNFRSNLGYTEDRLYRQIESTHAFHLELKRLSNFSISLVEGLQTVSGNVHLYRAVSAGSGIPRFFARLLSFPSDQNVNSIETLFVEALDHLTVILRKTQSSGSDAQSSNHIFVNVVAPDLIVNPDIYVSQLRKICTKYSQKLVNLAIVNVEMKVTCRLSSNSEPIQVRMVASNPTGFVLNIDQYYEEFSNGMPVFRSVTVGKGDLDGHPTTVPYSLKMKFEVKRAEALASSDTLYAYDWPVLFMKAVELAWESYFQERPKTLSAIPEDFFDCKELVLCEIGTQTPLRKGWTAEESFDSPLVPLVREAGLNDVGMVSWLISYKSPECMGGRQLIVICNDITHQAGSFGTKEDLVFFKASELARNMGVPRIYLAANSGARIGMAKSLQEKFQICWNDERDPSRGFKYIYLAKRDYTDLLTKKNNDIRAMPVICHELHIANEESRMVITDIIGEESDLGVENLMGSGLIAGETSRAYDKIFTLTLVVGRTVGIGAYLVRLGQRTIQKTRMSPIILTGYQALNKLMGSEIYTTNDQLGGPMIMFPNGVSHQLAENHLESVQKAILWLSFVPSKVGGALPLLDISGTDVVERSVNFVPPKGVTYDPRCLFDGSVSEDGCWNSGFLDKGSFTEYLGGWAKTVVVGRGRLGGIPIGVIVTENRTAEATKPADPADISSREKMVQQAGGVWFPDSAYKTAQALRDFNREGIPCMVFANWRGFSGGQRDMFDEVLKFGSMIVDALVAYQQPLFVYIPPHAELRGGAWVVVDSTINPDVMEFYAAEDARGGVLEATGAASIKFREKDIILAAHRLDHVLQDLDAQISQAKSLVPVNEKTLQDLFQRVKEREKSLYSVYQQVSVHFADLHDTPGRMQAKGVIRKRVDWSDSRIFFYWRLKRKLAEFGFIKAIRDLDGESFNRNSCLDKLKSWFLGNGGSIAYWDDDKYIYTWLEDHKTLCNSFLAKLRDDALISNLSREFGKLIVASKAASSETFVSEIILGSLELLSEADRECVLRSFQR